MVKDVFSKVKITEKLAQLMKRLLSQKRFCDYTNSTASTINNNNNNEVESDNAANEYLEARLMELISSSLGSMKMTAAKGQSSTVPACPDHICLKLREKYQLRMTSAQLSVS